VFRVITELLNEETVAVHDKYIKIIDKEKLLLLTTDEEI